MAKAVEDSAVVLVCVSQKYKESPSCRTGMWKVLCGAETTIRRQINESFNSLSQI